MPSRKYIASRDSPWTFNSTIRAFDGASTNSAVAKTKYVLFRSEGTITLSDTRTEYVISHEALSGIWRLSPASPSGAPALIVARKPSCFLNDFHLEMNHQHFTMVPASMWLLNFSVHHVPNANITSRGVTGEAVGELRTKYFQRDYDISFDEEVSLEFTAFCFWLVIMIQRRQSK